MKITVEKSFLDMLKYSVKYQKEIQQNKNTIIELEHLRDSLNPYLRDFLNPYTNKKILPVLDKILVTISTLKKINMYIIRNGSNSTSIIKESIINLDEFKTLEYYEKKSLENSCKTSIPILEDDTPSQTILYAYYIVDNIQYYLNDYANI